MCRTGELLQNFDGLQMSIFRGVYGLRSYHRRERGVGGVHGCIAQRSSIIHIINIIAS